jgi:hypothetical protein
MALVFECTSECARNPLDTADIVRDGDFSTVMGLTTQMDYFRVDDQFQFTTAFRRHC